mmetsp:Transcript_43125/g.113462  ORF Transcript_43125/g.113462 Transcript_43125/m.113462 type:complete len:476 (-) Transcript_43125:2014-3441(-)
MAIRGILLLFPPPCGTPHFRFTGLLHSAGASLGPIVSRRWLRGPVRYAAGHRIPVGLVNTTCGASSTPSSPSSVMQLKRSTLDMLDDREVWLDRSLAADEKGFIPASPREKSIPSLIILLSFSFSSYGDCIRILLDLGAVDPEPHLCVVVAFPGLVSAEARLLASALRSLSAMALCLAAATCASISSCAVSFLSSVFSLSSSSVSSGSGRGVGTRLGVPAEGGAAVLLLLTPASPCAAPAALLARRSAASRRRAKNTSTAARITRPARASLRSRSSVRRAEKDRSAACTVTAAARRRRSGSTARRTHREATLRTRVTTRSCRATVARLRRARALRPSSTHARNAAFTRRMRRRRISAAITWATSAAACGFPAQISRRDSTGSIFWGRKKTLLVPMAKSSSCRASTPTCSNFPCCSRLKMIVTSNLSAGAPSPNTLRASSCSSGPYLAKRSEYGMRVGYDRDINTSSSNMPPTFSC